MYRVQACFQGLDDDLDEKLENIVGKRSCGSGFSLIDGERYIAWVYRFEADAKKAYRKLKRFKNISVEISDEKND